MWLIRLLMWLWLVMMILLFLLILLFLVVWLVENFGEIRCLWMMKSRGVSSMEIVMIRERWLVIVVGRIFVLVVKESRIKLNLLVCVRLRVSS